MSPMRNGFREGLAVLCSHILRFPLLALSLSMALSSCGAARSAVAGKDGLPKDGSPKVGSSELGAGRAVMASLVVAEDADSVTCRDADGAIAVIRKRPKRVIVNYTSLVEPWYQAGGTAIGRPDTSTASELPEAARGVATTGRATHPNVERLIALEPDLIILSAGIERQMALKETLSGAGIQTLSLSYVTYADYLGILDLFFRLNGGSIASDKAAAGASEAIEALRAKTSAVRPPRFLSLFASTVDVQAETDRAHTAFMASYLGATNIARGWNASPAATRVAMSLERIHMEDPDAILVTTMGDSARVRDKMRDEFMDSESWKSLRAVREGKVYFLPAELFLFKPNSRFPEAFKTLADALYPGVR